MTARLPIVSTLLVLVALAGVLAGCRSDDSSPALSAAGASSTERTPVGADGSSAAAPSTATGTGTGTPTRAATTSATGCPEAIANNTYVRATSAHAEGNAVVVTAHPAQRVCRGPNNGHYEVATATEHLTVPASATVVMLTTTPSGLGHETVAPSDLPKRLVDDRFGRMFEVQGPRAAVTSLEEQYHP